MSLQTGRLLFDKHRVSVHRLPSGLVIEDARYAWKPTFWIVAISYILFMAMLLVVPTAERGAPKPILWDGLVFVTFAYAGFLWIYVKRQTLFDFDKSEVTLIAHRLMTRTTRRLLPFATIECLQINERLLKTNGYRQYTVNLRLADGKCIPVCDQLFIDKTDANDFVKCISEESGISINPEIPRVF